MTGSGFIFYTLFLNSLLVIFFYFPAANYFVINLLFPNVKSCFISVWLKGT